jgi:type 1 glutamine amidotransferase
MTKSIYSRISIEPAVRGLLTMDTHPNYGQPGDYPVAWCRDYGKGRAFYSSLGHRVDVVQRADIKKHFLGGVLWSLGLAPGKGTPHDLRLSLSEANAARDSNRCSTAWI